MVGVAKPPYQIPSVADIAALEGSNSLTAISTFAGAGGSSTGYRWAGYQMLYASEYLDNAADTYESNWPTLKVDRRDIRVVAGTEILEMCSLERGQLDLLDGSPPCQPFSTAGLREKSWGRTMEHNDGTVNQGGSEDLVGEWVRLIGELNPKAAVMENVVGLTRGKAKGYLIRTLAQVRALGYQVGAQVLDAQWLGVPQSRKRVYVMAVRSDVGRPAFPTPLPYRYVMADACPWLLAYLNFTGAGGKFSAGSKNPRTKAIPTMTSSSSNQHLVMLEDRSQIEPTMREEVETASLIPAPDLSRHRRLTISEARRLCGFPDDYILTGSFNDQWARLGNAVPPPMARAVGLALTGVLKPNT